MKWILAILFLPALAMAQSELEIKAQEIERNLVAPCCWAKTVDQEQSEIAVHMKQEIRQRLARGQSVDEIYARYEKEYGERILAKPKTSGLNWMVWLFPALFLMLGGFFLYVKLTKMQSNPERHDEPLQPNEQDPKGHPIDQKDQKYIDQIEKELYRS